MIVNWLFEISNLRFDIEQDSFCLTAKAQRRKGSRGGLFGIANLRFDISLERIYRRGAESTELAQRKSI